MIVTGSAVSGDLTLKTRIVVVGSGPGGATAAAVLAEAGHEVVVLEEGPYVTSADLTQREGEMMGLLFQEGGTRSTEDKGITVLHGGVVGGGSVVNHLICFRTPDRLLELWAAEGIEDLTPAAMAPRFDRIWQVLNVARIRPDQLNRNNALLRQGATALGWEGDCFERNAYNCFGSGFCTIGCAYDAKQSAALTWIPLASAAGARIQADARVERILHTGGRATGVEGVLLGPDRRPKGRLRVDADIVLVAGGAIRTPALLLRSGVPDPGGQIGRNLHLHPGTPVVGHFPDQDVNSWDGILQGYHVSEFSWPLAGHPTDALLEGVSGPPGVGSTVVFGLGAEHAANMARFRHFAVLGVLLRDETAGRVTVDGDGRPRVAYTLGAADRSRLREASKRAMEAWFAAGAADCYTGHVRPFRAASPTDAAALDGWGYGPGEVGIISYHQMGAARMGGSRERHATNPDGRIWDLDNVYVTDGSLFPTASGVNPQISIYGMALRVAERLRDRLG